MAELTVRRTYNIRIDNFDYIRVVNKWDAVVPTHKLIDTVTRQADTKNYKGPHMGILYLVRDDHPSAPNHYWCTLETVSAHDLKILESIQYLVEEVRTEVE